MRRHLVLIVLIVLIPVVLGIILDELYPFGSQTLDTAMDKNDDGSSPNIPISTLFPFFNHQHSTIIVNTNGVISFLRPVTTFTPNPFPIANNARMIAPFWTDVNTRNGGTVWYRESTEKDLLDRATVDIRTYFPQFFRFKASWIFIATWERVAFYGCQSECSKRTNTFQAVLITNGQHSFTIYNFENIQWTTGTASGGDSNGLGGTPAQVGFNAGDGIVYFTVKASRTPDIVNVDEYSNVKIPGKFAFRIDTSDISDGGCNTEGSLTITPRYGPMLGGQYVAISGPCVEQGATIRVLSFGLPKKCERKSDFSFVCITPIFSNTGDVLFLINIENKGVNSTFRGLYTVLNPAVSKHKVYRHNYDDWSSGYHHISWDPDAAELQDDDKVDIHLFSLKVGANRALTWQKEILIQGLNRSSGTEKVFLQTNGYALALRVTDSTPRTDQFERGIWSDIFPLALPAKEAVGFCKQWVNAEAKMSSLSSKDVQPCPCTLDQALLDVVRFQPDPECNLFNLNVRFSRSGNCLYRKAAKHCIRMTELGRNADNLCCYDQKNNLIDSRLTEGGSLQRYHYLGGSGIDPYLHNFYFDVLPFLYCCRYSKDDDLKSKVENVCPSFFAYRSISSCLDYQPPRPARTNGDPHITTLDGYSYTFNGVGEFIYLKTIDENFESHIRFEQFIKENGELAGASVCTAFASRHFNTSGTIEVRLNSIRTADVLINGELVDFDESLVHQFPGSFVMLLETNQSSINTRRKELIVSFTEIGIAFKVIASDKVLNILPVVGKKSLAGTLKGLLGDFDGNQDNELQTPSGEMLSQNSTSEEIFDGFGVLWRITENITLFTYEPGKSYNDYQKLSFRPTFGLPSNPSPEVEELCGTDQECTFDYIVTASSNFAAETLYITEIFNASIEATYEVKNCEELPSVDGGVWNATNTLEGSSATFSCYPGYEIEGTSNIVTCVNNSWGSFGNFDCILIGGNGSSTVEVDTSTESTSTTDGLYTANQPTTTSTTDEKTTDQSTTSATEEVTPTTTSAFTPTITHEPSTEDLTTNQPTTLIVEEKTTTTTSTTTIQPTTTTEKATTTNQPSTSTPDETTTITPMSPTTEEVSRVTTSTSTFPNEASTTTTTTTTTALPTTPATEDVSTETTTRTTSSTTMSTTTPSVTTTYRPTTTTEDAPTTITRSHSMTSVSTTDNPTKPTPHSTLDETSMTTEIQSTTTSILSKTFQQFDREFQKIRPYLIGAVIIIIFVSIFVGLLLCRSKGNVKKEERLHFT